MFDKLKNRGSERPGQGVLILELRSEIARGAYVEQVSK